METPTINEQISYEVPEHQVLLSFVNDSDALAFYEWWYAEGFKHLQKYVKKQLVKSKIL